MVPNMYNNKTFTKNNNREGLVIEISVTEF